MIFARCFEFVSIAGRSIVTDNQQEKNASFSISEFIQLLYYVNFGYLVFNLADRFSFHFGGKPILR